MNYLLTILLLTLPCLSAFAQKADTTKVTSKQAFNPNDRRNGYETYQSMNQVVGAGPNTMINTIDHRYEGLRGTPYFLPEWNKGQIEMVAGQHYKEAQLKFDAYRQHLVMLRPWAGNDSIIVNANMVKSFEFKSDNGQIYTFRHLPGVKTDDEALKEGYFLVLYQGKSSLLKRVVKSFRKADYKNPYANGNRYDEFKDIIAYYILKPDNTLEKVKLTDKAIIEVLGAHEDDLKNFAKQEKLSGKTETDAVRLIQKYDSF